MASFFICRRKPEECQECGFCTEYFCCPGVGRPNIDRFETACVDCGVCYLACPYMAVERVKDTLPRKEVKITVDGNRFTAPERTTIKRALELLGLEFGKFPGEAKIFAPCETGGCYACSLLVNGEPKPACVTSVQEGMTISLTLPKDYVPLRRISGFQPHAVGGVGTPWWVKKSGNRYIEVACFAHGCNLRCPQCLPSFEKMLVKVNGHTYLISIGELFERESDSKESIVCFKPARKIEVISFNPETFRVSWAPVSTLIKRKGDGEILEIKVRTGREIHVSPDHLMFVLGSNELIVKRAADLKVGDYILTAKHLLFSHTQALEQNEIDLIEEFSRLELSDVLWVSGVREIILKKAKLLTKQEVGARKWKNELCVAELGRQLGGSKGSGWLWYKKDRMPLTAYLKMETNESLRKKLRIGIKGTKSGWIPVIIPVNKDLLRFIGYYLAEGNADGGMIRFSFNVEEEDLVNEVKDIISDLFGLPSTIKVQLWKGKKSCLVLTVYGEILALLMKNILNIGHDCYSKRVPDFVYNLPQSLIHELIDAYFLGDGSAHPTRPGSKSIYVHSWTASEELLYGLDLLLLMTGVATRIARAPNGYMIFVQGGKSTEKFLNFASIAKRKGLTHNPAFLRRSLSEQLPLFLAPSFQKALSSGDVYPVKIIHIKRQPYYGDLFDLEIQDPSAPYANFMHGISIFTHNCQNYTVTYDNVMPPSTPIEAATVLTAQRNKYGVDRMAISGGEPTLNRPWLIQFFQELHRLNPDLGARLHLDTNATVLTPEYVDLLVEAGMTDIGPDLKGSRTETFMKITGIIDRKLAERYLKNAWAITKYVLDNCYPDSVFLGIGIPYNKHLITLDEIREMGQRIAALEPEVQVCLLDYFPTFRRLNMERPSAVEMRRARETLLEAGLKTVLAQTVVGHIGP